MRLAVLLLSLLQDADELRRRAEAAKQEERAHQEKIKAADAARKKALEAAGIVDVAALGAHADPARAVDAVFIGDAFTKEEQAAYNAIVDTMAKNFQTAPFDAHPSRLNLHRVNLVSGKSGIAADGEAPQTPLSGTVKAFPGGKLLACDAQKAAELVRLAVPHADFVLAVLNTHEKFLGSANTGQIVILSTSKAHQGSLVVHEFSHNIDAFLDEYVDGKQSGERPPPASLEEAINVTLESNVLAAKWHHWNVPQAVFKGEKRGKPFEPEDNVRCYEGAATFTDKVYRAEENCHMQRGRGKEFCRVCREGMELSLSRWFTPIESVSPHADALHVARGQAVELQVTPLALTEGAATVRVAWYLDGARLNPKSMKASVPKDGGPRRWTYAVRDLAEGTRQVTVSVEIDSPRVHMDRGRFSGSFTWTIEVSAPRPPPPRTVAGEAGQPVTFTAAEAPADAPAGVEFDKEKGEVRWTPPGPGAWVVGPTLVNVPRKPSNRAPKPLFLPEQAGREGEALSFAVLAWDPDGDHVAATCVNLPPGARLDGNTGRFEWKPGSSQRGTYALEFVVTDGEKPEKRTVRCAIAGAALHRGIFKPDSLDAERPVDWMLTGLNAPDADARLAAAKRLAEAPAPTAAAHALRLARDADPRVAQIGLERLKSLDAACLDILLDQAPFAVWQFVDQPEALAALGGVCKSALAAKPPSSRAKELQAVLKDLEIIDGYNRDRKTKPPRPPVTDKKLK